MTKARILVQTVSAGNVLADSQISLVELGLDNVSNTPDNTKEVLSATKWANARTLNFSGDATGSLSVDGSQDTTTTLTLTTSGVTAGSYTNATFTVDATWAKLYEIIGEVEYDARPMPESYTEIEPELPQLVWTEA